MTDRIDDIRKRIHDPYCSSVELADACALLAKIDKLQNVVAILDADQDRIKQGYIGDAALDALRRHYSTPEAAEAARKAQEDKP